MKHAERRSTPHANLATARRPAVSASIGRPDLAPQLPTVAIFVDLSNIFYGAKDAAAQHDETVGAIRLQADRLRDLLADRRRISRACIVANADVPPEVAAYFGREFAEWIPREAGKLSGTEQANDETLQVRMYEAMHQLEPGVLVLATGDGAGWPIGRGFVAALDTAYREGWAVEVAAWPRTVNPAIRRWLTDHRGAFIDLDDYYYSVTFVEGGRRTQAVTHGYRPDANGAVRPAACSCNRRPLAPLPP